MAACSESNESTKWRLAMLKRMRQTDITSDPSIDVTSPDKKIKLDEYTYQHRYDQTEYEIFSATKQKSGEKFPKVIFEGKSRRATPKFTLEAMTVHQCFLGENGDYSIRTQSKKNARFLLKLCTGVAVTAPDNVRDHVNVGKQQECLDWVKNIGRGALEHSFHDEEIWPEIPRSDDSEEFINAGNLSYLKTVRDDNGKDENILVLQSRLDNYDGSSNKPRFWRKTKEGGYVQEEIELTEGSLVAPRLSFRFWGGDFSQDSSRPDYKYGASADLCRDILVIWRAPKVEAKVHDGDEEEHEETSTDNIPFVEDW